MSARVNELYISLIKRSFANRSSVGSSTLADIVKEISVDLVNIQSEWNSKLIPILAALPAGAQDPAIDAYLNGIDGKNVYADAMAGGISLYYDRDNSRPYTIYEKLQDLYSVIASIELSLQEQIDSFSGTAEEVSIEDASSIYTAENVEEALQEVMERVNLAGVGTLEGLSDTAISGSSAGDTLLYDGATWENTHLGDLSLLDTISSSGLINNGIVTEEKLSPELADKINASGSAPWQEDRFDSTVGQITFITSNSIVDLDSLVFSVNGVDYLDTEDYVVDGTTITWLNTPFPMEVGDIVIVKYRR